MKVNPNLIGADHVMRLRFLTNTFETDPHYHARLSFYFGVVQDIAGLHAACRNMSIPELQEKGMTWVILRTKMHVNRYTAWPEDIMAETWAQAPLGLKMPRVVRAQDEEGKPLFEAITEWAVLDLTHHYRPVRPNAITEAMKIPSENDSKHHRECKLPRRTEFDDSALAFTSRYVPPVLMSDTDANHHVNNISYLNWILESLPVPFRDAYKVEDVDVSWEKQTFLGDMLVVMTGSGQSHPLEEEKPSFVHKIIRKGQDGTEETVFQGTTTWEKRFSLANRSRFSV